jgi:hypothetical protein
MGTSKRDMHRHNLDLIAEYAGGTLADDKKARNLVANCQVCRAEYEAHRSVLAALSSVERNSMSEHEKARLHRDVASALRGPTSKPSAARAWWPTWAASAAAVLVVTVGLMGVLNSLGDSSSSADMTFSEIGSALDGGAGAGFGGEERNTDAPGQEPQAPPAGADYFYDEDNSFDSVAKSVLELTNRTSTETVSGDDNACLEESGLIDYRLVPDVERLTTLLVAVSAETGDSTPTVAFIDPDTCQVVHLEE